MSNFGLKIAVLLVVILCVNLLHTSVVAETKSDKTEAPAKISVPDKGFTIVLRAPMSGNPQIVKVSKNRKGEINEKPGQKFSVYLPKNTPVFFRVDQVNTVLHTVEITVNGKEPKAKDPSEFSLDKAINCIRVIHEFCPEDADRVKDALGVLKDRIKIVGQLNQKFDELLYESEMWQFYTPDPMKNFEKIKSKSKKLTQDLLGLRRGTPQAICDDAEEVIARVRKACEQLDGAKKAVILAFLPKDLSDPSDDIAAIFLKTAEKLGKIETATWYQDDVQERVLEQKIEYTCFIIPAITPEVKGSSLTRKKFVVTVHTPLGLSGIKFTAGSFVSELTDDYYVKDQNGKVALGSQNRFSMPVGGLAHAVLCSKSFGRFSGALAVSTGFALGTATKHGQLVLNGQAALGGSFLFAGPSGEGDMFAVTVGGILKPVQRLNGYWVGDPFPSGTDQPTRAVYRVGVFVGLTANFNFLPRIFGLNQQTTSRK